MNLDSAALSSILVFSSLESSSVILISGNSPSPDTFNDPYSYKLKISVGEVAVMVFKRLFLSSGCKSLSNNSSDYLSSDSCFSNSPTSMVYFDLICSSFLTIVLYSSSISFIFWSIS
jgi:hypothetical protein